MSTCLLHEPAYHLPLSGWEPPRLLDELSTQVSACLWSALHVALHSHHAHFICPLTDVEKERDKQWIKDNIGLVGWWEGWIMYDGTIMILYKKPGLNGDAYYTQTSNYGLNAQVQPYPASPVCVYWSIFFRSGMFHQIYISSTSPMAWQALPMIPLHLCIQQQVVGQSGCSKAMSLPPLILHIPWLHGLFLFTKSQQVFNEITQSLIQLLHIFKFNPNIAWVLWRAIGNVYMVSGFSSIATDGIFMPVDALQLWSYFTTLLLTPKEKNGLRILLNSTICQRNLVLRIKIVLLVTYSSLYTMEMERLGNMS